MVLVEKGYVSNINAHDTGGNTALMLAASSGHTEVVRFLLIRGADPFLSNKRGHTALSLALGRGDSAIANLLRVKMAQLRGSLQS